MRRQVRVADPQDRELAEVAAALQPHPSQEVVQLSQRGVGSNRQLQPVEPVAVVHRQVQGLVVLRRLRSRRLGEVLPGNALDQKDTQLGAKSLEELKHRLAERGFM